MGKRKKDIMEDDDVPRKVYRVNSLNSHQNQMLKNVVTIQIITGSYERELHGIAASILHDKEISHNNDSLVNFSDSFLFNAHSSAIKCLAISPLFSKDGSPSEKIILASGGTDERVNLYHLSTSTTRDGDQMKLSIPTLAGLKILENPKNRELGSLVHHSSSVTALYFPTQSKLLSAAEDNTIAITRTRDWTMLSTIKAPIPKATGRPSGDTAPPGDAPCGVNDFAVHPSMKLMISVGKGERCMRLWNLITGKKAGVLTFERDLLQKIGEGKWGSGEGRKVKWNVEGNEFVVSFERGAVVFGMDSKPKCHILPSPRTKLHHIHYIPLNCGKSNDLKSDVLAVSTEDGRILFYSSTASRVSETDQSQPEQTNYLCQPICQLGGNQSGLTGRIKVFEVLEIPGTCLTSVRFVVITASSNGFIRLWGLTGEELSLIDTPATNEISPNEGSHDEQEISTNNAQDQKEPQPCQVGQLLGTYETGRRITCLKAFIMPDITKEIVEELNSEFADEFSGFEAITDDGQNGQYKT